MFVYRSKLSLICFGLSIPKPILRRIFSRSNAVDRSLAPAPSPSSLLPSTTTFPWRLQARTYPSPLILSSLRCWARSSCVLPHFADTRSRLRCRNTPFPSGFPTVTSWRVPRPGRERPPVSCSPLSFRCSGGAALRCVTGRGACWRKLWNLLLTGVFSCRDILCLGRLEFIDADEDAGSMYQVSVIFCRSNSHGYCKHFSRGNDCLTVFFDRTFRSSCGQLASTSINEYTVFIGAICCGRRCLPISWFIAEVVNAILVPK